MEIHGLDFSWIQKLNDVDFAVVVSKSANVEFEDALFENREKVLYHATCTGLGGTKFEPFAPTSTEKLLHLRRLIYRGFPTNHIVLRIEPVFPIGWISILNSEFKIEYKQKLKNILAVAKELGITRVKYSYFSPYDYALSRLQQISPLFNLPPAWMPLYENELQLDKLVEDISFETETTMTAPRHQKLPEISEKDFAVMNVQFAPFSKLELLQNENGFNCNFNCEYCYWRKAAIDNSRIR